MTDSQDDFKDSSPLGNVRPNDVIEIDGHLCVVTENHKGHYIALKDLLDGKETNHTLRFKGVLYNDRNSLIDDQR